MATRQTTISIKSILSPKTNSGSSNHVVELDKQSANHVKHRQAILHIENEAKHNKIKINRDNLTPIELAKQNGVTRLSDTSTTQANSYKGESNPSLNKKHRKNSFEIMRNQNKRLEFAPVPKLGSAGHFVQNNPPIRESHEPNNSNGYSRGNSTEKMKDSESDENTVDTETDYSDTTIKMSDDEGMELDYDDLKTAGPINTNLRDLYCSNYLEYKLQILRRKESKLSERIIEKTHAFYPDIEDVDKEDGLLI